MPRKGKREREIKEMLDAIFCLLRLRRQKLSEAARNRYALLSEEEKRAVTERRVVMRQRRKQKEREMEELEAILRASNGTNIPSILRYSGDI